MEWLHVGAVMKEWNQFWQKWSQSEALMCTQCLCHTDSSEEWATSWSWTWVKKGLRPACWGGSSGRWSNRGEERGFKISDWDKWTYISLAATSVGWETSLLKQKTHFAIIQTLWRWYKIFNLMFFFKISNIHQMHFISQTGNIHHIFFSHSWPTYVSAPYFCSWSELGTWRWTGRQRCRRKKTDFIKWGRHTPTLQHQTINRHTV